MLRVSREGLVCYVIRAAVAAAVSVPLVHLLVSACRRGGASRFSWLAPYFIYSLCRHPSMQIQQRRAALSNISPHLSSVDRIL